MGCQVSKEGVQNQIDLWPNINILQINYCILSKIGQHVRKQSVFKLEIVKKTKNGSEKNMPLK